MTYALVPTALTDSMLVSSTVPEPAAGEAEWNSATAYTAGQTGIILAATHRKYKALQANTNKSPADPVNLNVYWVDDGPTLRWAMFDGGTSFQTTGTGPLTVVVKPGFCSSIYLGGLEADGLEVTYKDAPGGTVIRHVVDSLEGSEPGDWWEYWFAPFKPRTDYLITGLPPYSQCEVTITLTGSGTLKCGIASFGDVRDVGKAQYGAKASPRSYSTVKTTNGVSSIVRRRAGNDLSLVNWAKLEDANAIHAALMDLLDVPCLWIGTDLPNYNGLRSWGLGKGTISYDYPQDIFVTIEVTGLIK